jgi:protein involved in polysaccharide export with SLBB domain
MTRALTPALAALTLLTGCGTTQSITVHPREAAGFAPWSDQAPVYRLGAGDKVKIDYALTPELNQETVVEPDGAVALKALGRLPAQNLTMAEFQAMVEEAAARRLRHPLLTISLVEPHAARIVVGGQVGRPGVYPLPARATTLEAVMLAGGLLPESRMDEVVVLRQRPGQPPMLRTVDLRSFVSSGSPRESITLASEDIVFVPRSRVAEVDLWIDQYVNKLLPFSRSVSYTKGSYTP